MRDGAVALVDRMLGTRSAGEAPIDVAWALRE
jgi:hypothetical protein